MEGAFPRSHVERVVAKPLELVHELISTSPEYSSESVSVPVQEGFPSARVVGNELIEPHVAGAQVTVSYTFFRPEDASSPTTSNRHQAL